MRKPIILALTTCAVVAVASVGITAGSTTAGAASASTLVSSPELDSHVIFQDFSFFQPYESDTYTTLTARAKELKKLGITDVWMAPPYRALNAYLEEGYAVTDRYDLGEFPAGHNNATATKYGTSDQLKDAIKALHAEGISVQADIVPNQLYLYQDREVTPVTAVDQYGNLGTSAVRGKLYETYTVGGGAGQQKYGTFSTWKSADLNGISPQGLGIDRVMLDENGKPYRYLGGDATKNGNYVPAGMADAANINNIDGYLTVDGYFIAGKNSSGGDIYRPNLMYYTEHQAGAVTISYLDYVRAHPPVGSGIASADSDDVVRTKLIAASDSAVVNTTNDYIGAQPGYNSTSEAGITALRFDNNDVNDVNQNLLQYEYLIGQDVDNTNATVKAEQTNWEKFLYDDYGFDGFRWDAAGHYNKNVLTDGATVAAQERATSGTSANDSLNFIESYVPDQVAFENANGNPQLAYDYAPYYAYQNALGKGAASQDLSSTITTSMVNRVDTSGTAIPNWSFVNNHDQEHNVMAVIPVTDLQTGGQPYGTKEYQLAQYKIYSADRKRVAKQYAPYNVPASYAIELSNKNTVPTVFYGDMYEATDTYMKTETPYYDAISTLLDVRKTNATGVQVVSNYASNLSTVAGKNLISSVREGTDRMSGMGVVVGNTPDLDTTISVPMGAVHANQEYVDAMGYHDETLTTDASGNLTVEVVGSSTVDVNGYLGVWVPKTASAEPTATATPTATPTTDPTTAPTPAPEQPQVPVVPAAATGPVATTTRQLVTPKSISFGQTTSLAATVDIGATGTVSFQDGSKTLFTGTLENGLVSTTSPDTLKVGTHSITAVYSGDATHAASTSAASVLTVKKAATKVAVVKKSSVKGGKTSITAKATSVSNGAAATGKVRVYVGKKVVKTVVLHAKNKGAITVTLPKKYSATIKVKAKYLGSSKLSAKTSVTIKVVPRKK